MASPDTPVVVVADHVPAHALVATGVTTAELAALDPHDRRRLELIGFEPKPGQVQFVVDAAGERALVGLGARDRLDAEGLRRAAGAMARACARTGHVATTLATDAALDPVAASAAIADGVLAATYRFDRHRTRASAPALTTVTIVVPGDALSACAAAVERARVVDRARRLTRDLVNEPGGTMTPTAFAECAAALPGLRVVAHGLREITDLGMGGLLGVNRGSRQPPVFLEVHHEPTDPVGPTLGLVGKGITFDTGGINLKQKASALLTMKSDMAGAAAVLGAMSVLGELGVRSTVRAFLPLTDNMTGGDATRPGDVLQMFDGTTTEVVDTDAEGRLVLADALAFATTRGGVDQVIDIATLTGTQIHVTGLDVAPVYGTSPSVVGAIEAAARRCGEKVWAMPRVPEYQALLRSSIADRTNRSEAPAASAFAALFLEGFVGDVPWAHIDMAACALSERDTDAGPAGARGWGAALLVEVCCALARD